MAQPRVKPSRLEGNLSYGKILKISELESRISQLGQFESKLVGFML